MDINIYRFSKFDKESNLKAFVDLIIDNEVIIKGFKLVEGKEGLFLANPSEKGKDNKYFDTIRFNTLEKKKEVEQMIINKYLEKENK